MIAKKALIKVSIKYTDFIHIFSLGLASKLLEHTKINTYAIKLVNDEQLSYELIYSLESIELKILKTYIKINLANRFIKPSKSLVGASIFFNQKLNGFFWLYVNYKDPNNLTIKNCYLLSLLESY